MALTGSFFLDGIIALTIAAFVAVIWLWPRLTRGTPLHVAGRAGALVVVNLLVLLTAATQMNAAYLFFANWTDLRGAITGTVTQTTQHRGGADQAAAGVAVKGPVEPVVDAPAALPADPSGLTNYVVHGAASGLTGNVLVQLPAGYATAPATKRYPVLEAFHGYPSEPSAWVDVFHLPQMVAQAAAAHQLQAPIVVMPQIEFPSGVDTEGVNGGPGQPLIETWLTQDVPAWLGQHFRVVANRDAWASVGYSAGGFDAAMATVLHPAQYGAGIVLGGYFHPEFGPFYEPFTPTSAAARRYDLVRAVRDQHPPVSLWLETSHADPVSYQSSAQFLRATSAPTSVQAVILQNAGHRVSVWINLLPQSLRWLGQNVAGFHP